VSSQDKDKTGKKLALDEQTFQQLLESAYVLQQHNAEQTSVNQPLPTHADPLGEVVETQKFIQLQKLDLAETAELIVEKARAIVNANSAAIGIVENNFLIFSSTSGSAAVEPGTRVPISQSVAAPVLLPDSALYGKIVLSSDVNTTPELNAELYRAQGIRSLILIPVQYEGKIEGVLELTSDRKEAFSAQDVRIAELMASLLRDAIVRAAQIAWKETVAAERTTMLEALDAIQPQIERLISPTATVDTAPAPLSEVPPTQFSAAEFSNHEPVFSSARLGDEFKASETALVEEKVAPIPQVIPQAPFIPIQTALSITEAEELDSESVPVAMEEPKAPWMSATSTRQWLETLRPEKSGFVWLSKQWHANRANFYLAFSALLLLAVLSGWGTHSSNRGISANAATSAQPAKPQLSLFERSLVAVGLADPPPQPPNLGNPNTQVWIDLHTALYYCPGSPMYGKTPGGKFSLQRDAQLDQFEPANRQVCQ